MKKSAVLLFLGIVLTFIVKPFFAFSAGALFGMIGWALIVYGIVSFLRPQSALKLNAATFMIVTGIILSFLTELIGYAFPGGTTIFSLTGLGLIIFGIIMYVRKPTLPINLPELNGVKILSIKENLEERKSNYSSGYTISSTSPISAELNKNIKTISSFWNSWVFVIANNSNFKVKGSLELSVKAGTTIINKYSIPFEIDRGTQIKKQFKPEESSSATAILNDLIVENQTASSQSRTRRNRRIRFLR